jgi:hypothetical protein
MAGFELTLYGRIWVTPEVQFGLSIYSFAFWGDRSVYGGWFSEPPKQVVRPT